MKMKHTVKLLILAVLIAALMIASIGCYPLRIARNPNPSGGDTDVMNTEFPDATGMPTQTLDGSIEPTMTPDDTEAPVASTTTLPTETPDGTGIDASPTAGVAPTASPTQAAGTTPTPSATNTPSPTPTPVATEAPTPTPSQNTSDFADFSSGTINGYGTYTNSMFANAPLTMINFWATWCGPCIEELPHIQQLSSTFAGRVQIVTVLYDSSTQGATEQALAILQSIGVTVPVIRCNASVRNAFVNPYGISALPATFFVDSNGSLVRLVSGSHDYNQWVSLINNLL